MSGQISTPGGRPLRPRHRGFRAGRPPRHLVGQLPCAGAGHTGWQRRMSGGWTRLLSPCTGDAAALATAFAAAAFAALRPVPQPRWRVGGGPAGVRRALEPKGLNTYLSAPYLSVPYLSVPAIAERANFKERMQKRNLERNRAPHTPTTQLTPKIALLAFPDSRQARWGGEQRTRQAFPLLPPGALACALPACPPRRRAPLAATSRSPCSTCAARTCAYGPLRPNCNASWQAQASEDQRTVKLRSLQLGSRAGPLLARSLSPSVTSLDLHGNGGLSESGALALIPLIVDGGTLRSLARCGVGTAGAAALGGTLAASNVLQTLSLCRSATRARRRSQRRSRATEGSHHSTSRARGSATARRGGWGSRCRATPGCARCASTTTT